MNDLQAAVTLREADEPGWHPSADLAEKIKQKSLRAGDRSPRSRGETGAAWCRTSRRAVPYGRRKTPKRCGSSARAFARQNDCAEAYIVYRLLLTNHSDPAERLATIQRAIATVPMDYVEKLLAMGRPERGRPRRV